MEEIKYYKPKEEKKQDSKEETPKDPNLSEKVDQIYDALKGMNKKEIKIPRKAKVKKGKMRKGWFGVIYINENGNIYGEKAKVDDFVFREKKAIRYHATDGREILFWMGKIPVILQPTWRLNPINVRSIVTKSKDKEGEEKYIVNETYGQKYIMARMLADIIKVKTAGGKAILWILGVGIIGYIAYTILTGGA